VGTYCSSGTVCVNGTCALIAGLASGAPAPAPAGGVSVASLLRLVRSPQQACLAARAEQQGCAADASPLLRTDGTRLGYAVTFDTECFESAAFKCCAAPGGALVSACKGAVLLENAFTGLVNGTASLFNYVASVAANSSSGGGAAGAGGAGGVPVWAAPAGVQSSGADGNATAAAAAVATAVLTRPVVALEPVFQGLASVVTNVSRALLGPLNKTTNGTLGGGAGQWGTVSYSSASPKYLVGAYSSGAGGAGGGGLAATAAAVSGRGRGGWPGGKGVAGVARPLSRGRVPTSARARLSLCLRPR
jgi:hypothetical protein